MKTKKIISLGLTILPALMLALSAAMKFAASPQIVDGLSKIGFLPYFSLPLLATIELGSVILFFVPKTSRIGFFLLCGYLGGAGAIEIASHQPPAAFVLLTLIWIGTYLKDGSLFLVSTTK